MELKEYFKIIGRYKTLFWVLVIITGLSAFLWSRFQPQSYLASTTLTVNKSANLKQSELSYYIFDNYYNVQSAGLFSQIIASWFESPAVVKQIYKKAEVDLPDISQKKLTKIFKAVREEPATINVSLGGSDQEEIEKLVNASAEVMQDKTNELGKADLENVYDIVKFEPIISETTPNIFLNTIIGLIAGAILGVVIILSADYFRRD